MNISEPYNRRDYNRSWLIAVLNNRRDKRYRTGALQLALSIMLITPEEFSRMFHKVRCGRKHFVKDDLA